MCRNLISNSGSGTASSAGLSTRPEDNLDQQHARRRHGPEDRHQYDGNDQQEPVAARVAQQPKCLPHASTRKRSTAAIARSTVISPIAPSDFSTSAGVRHGAQTSASDEPKNTSCGTPNAAARCAGPESLPAREGCVPQHLHNLTKRRSREIVLQGAKRLKVFTGSSYMKTGSNPMDCSKYRASSRKCSDGHVFSRVPASG